MGAKSFVTLEHKICPVCGVEHDYNCGILLDRSLRERFDQTTVSGWGLCEEHQKVVDDGYIILVAIDPVRSALDYESEKHVTIRPENAYRTGEIVYVKREVFKELIEVPEEEEVPNVVFVSFDVVEFFQKLKGEE